MAAPSRWKDRKARPSIRAPEYLPRPRWRSCCRRKRPRPSQRADEHTAFLRQGFTLQRQIDIGNERMFWRVRYQIDVMKIERKVAQFFPAVRQPITIQRPDAVTKPVVRSEMAQHRARSWRNFLVDHALHILRHILDYRTGDVETEFCWFGNFGIIVDNT